MPDFHSGIDEVTRAMTQEQARERAWEAYETQWEAEHDGSYLALAWPSGEAYEQGRQAFIAGARWRRQEDEQRIAALVAKVEMTAEAMEEEAEARSDGDSELVLRTFARMLWRALAGEEG